MAFTLAYGVTERNDNTLLTITDSTGEVSTGTATGWQVGGPNPDYTNIVASGGASTLELNIKLTKSDGIEITYDTIDLYTEFAPVGGFASVADLVFPLDCSMLIDNTVALGTSTDEFPDGIYELEYILDAGLGSEASTTIKVLLYGKVNNAVYELLRQLPYNYSADICYKKGTLDVLFMSTLIDSLEAVSVLGVEESILNQLSVLEKLVTNVSTYTW